MTEIVRYSDVFNKRGKKEKESRSFIFLTKLGCHQIWLHRSIKKRRAEIVRTTKTKIPTHTKSYHSNLVATWCRKKKKRIDVQRKKKVNISRSRGRNRNFWPSPRKVLAKSRDTKERAKQPRREGKPNKRGPFFYYIQTKPPQ